MRKQLPQFFYAVLAVIILFTSISFPVKVDAACSHTSTVSVNRANTGDCTKSLVKETRCSSCDYVLSRTPVTPNTSHDWDYGVCSVDGCTKKHQCAKSDLDYDSYDDTHHSVYCIVCDKILKVKESCSFIPDKDEEHTSTTHYAECNKCGNYDDEAKHVYKYEYKENNKHKMTCGCGYSKEGDCEYENNKCKYCEHEKESSSSSSSGGTHFYAPSDVTNLEEARKKGTALAKDVVTIKANGTSYDVSAIEAPLRDMANQYLIANILLSNIGFNKFTPTKTYKFKSLNLYSEPGKQQTIFWKNTGVAFGDTVYAVYWNPTKKTQILPVVVGPDGTCAFIVPDVNDAIVTLVKCEVEKPATTKKSKKKK